MVITAFGKLSGDHGRVKSRCQSVWQDSARFVLERLSVARDMKKEVRHSQSFSYRYRKANLNSVFRLQDRPCRLRPSAVWADGDAT